MLANKFVHRLLGGVALCLFWLQAAALEITPGFSGSWFDPAKDKQGLVIQVLGDGRAVATWFTYDTSGNPLWMQGAGVVSASRLVFDSMIIYSGGQLDGSHEPTDITSVDAGRLEISFSSCAEGVASYSGGAGLPADTLRLQRISSIAGFPCGSFSVAEPDGPLHRGLSGAWFDAQIANQGWMVELIGGQSALIYWFTYENGRQLWAMGVGEVDGAAIHVPTLLSGSGGRFGPAYDPNDVQLQPWGALNMVHVACREALVSYFRDSDGASDAFVGIEPLLNLGAADYCAFPGGLASVTGRFVPMPGVFIDGSTNDPLARTFDNSSRGQPQSISNPGVIAGFATETPMPQGVYASSTNELDFYRMTLLAGQTLQLIIGDWDPAQPMAQDLDLWLFRADENDPVASSISVTRNEYIQILEDGVYDVVVFAYAGSSAYSLVASYAPIPADAQVFNLMDPDLRLEAVVDRRQARPAGLRPEQRSELLERVRGAGFELDARSAGDRLGIYRASATRPSSLPTRAMRAPVATGSTARYQTLMASSQLSPEHRDRLLFMAAYKALAEAYGSDRLAPNLRLRAQQADPRRSQQWHYDAIQLAPAWLASRGQSTLVAVLDSGVAPHPDLESNIRYDLGLDVIDPSVNFDPNRRRGDDPAVPERINNSSHGTHVAGTIAAIAGNGRDGVGVAPAAQIMPVRVIGIEGEGSFAGIIDGIYWAAGQSNIAGLPDPARRADVINLSLGGFGQCFAPLQQAIDFARSQGVIVVAAAGNDTSSANFIPAVCDGVISVAAVNQFLEPASYSNCGHRIALTAPGGQIGDSSLQQEADWPDNSSGPRYLPDNPLGCRPDPQTIFNTSGGVYSTDFRYSGPSRTPVFTPAQGTSMAAPHVAGVMALIRSLEPSLTPAQVDGLIASGAITDRLGRSGWDREIGHGLIDALRAVAAVSDPGGLPSAVVARPASLFFGEFTTDISLVIERVGSNTGSITGFSSNAEWINLVTPVSVDSGGFGRYTVTASRSGLLPGTYRGSIRATTSTGLFVDIPVELSMPSATQHPDAGFLYAGIFEATSGHAVRVFGGPGTRTVYQFTAEGLVPGAYFIASWTNVAWQSGPICTPGNLCGLYPSTGQFRPVELLGGRDTDIGTIELLPDLSGVSVGGASFGDSPVLAPIQLDVSIERLPIIPAEQ